MPRVASLLGYKGKPFNINPRQDKGVIKRKSKKLQGKFQFVYVKNRSLIEILATNYFFFLTLKRREPVDGSNVIE